MEPGGFSSHFLLWRVQLCTLMAMAGHRTPSSKPEFPPLLAAGRHAMSIFELRKMCVDNFPTSNSRSTIMDGVEHVIDKLNLHRIRGEVWVDGSFLTQKIDPEDADLVLRIQAGFYENASHEQQQIVDWLSDDLKSRHNVDSYCFMEWEKSDPEYWFGEYMYAYWMRQWGFSRGDSAHGPNMKGIAVIDLPGATP